LAKALETAKAAGKIGAIGVSNFTVPQTKALMRYLDSPLISIQPELSALTLDPIVDGTLDMAMADDLTVLAWSPLGGGRLLDPKSEREKAAAAALQVVSEAQGVSLTAAAISWIMAHPARAIPIIGSQDPARIRAAGEALKVKWTRASWYTVYVASRGEPLP
jgi:predicted oxidoreductase